MKTIKKIIAILSIMIFPGLLILTFFYSCKEIEQEKIQLTKDEMDYLVVKPDTFHYTGDTYKLEDSLQYVVNKIDKVWVKYNTHIETLLLDPFLNENIVGSTSFWFNNISSVQWLEITVDKTTFSTEISLSYSSDKGYWTDYYRLDSIEALIDTFSLNGNVHENVVKRNFQRPEIHGFKKIYYKKRFGFILIETHDGERLEALVPEE